MTDAAAISGSFAEFRMVKTRSVCVLSIEIPVEQADAALKALGGVPQPGRERPVAVVLLDPTKYQAARTGDASPAGPHAEVAEAPATADARALPSPSTAPEVAGSGGHCQHQRTKTYASGVVAGLDCQGVIGGEAA